MRKLLPVILALLGCLAFASTAQASVLLGRNAVETTARTTSAPSSEAFGYTAIASGTAGSISVYLDSTGGVTVGLYAAGGSNRPGTRLATASNTSNVAHAWATIPIPNVPIMSGTQYWIAVGANGGSATYRDRSSGTSLDYTGTGFASPYARTAQRNHDPLSAYVSSTVSSLPVAAFTFSPASPAVGQTISFDGTGSSCANAPCTYTWNDDGGEPPVGYWALGTGISMQFTFQHTGTKYVRLTVQDAVGQTATVEHNVVVSTGSPTLPANTLAPTISGTTQQGSTLTASQGTWTGTAPISYTYLWSDGKTGSTDLLDAGDIGQNISVTVTATNTVGSASATSVSVGPITVPTILPPVPVSPPIITDLGIPAGPLMTSVAISSPLVIL
jgi:hypothetical protein